MDRLPVLRRFTDGHERSFQRGFIVREDPQVQRALRERFSAECFRGKVSKVRGAACAPV